MRAARRALTPLLVALLAANAGAPRDYALDSVASEVKAKVSFMGLGSKSMTFPKMKGQVRIVPDAPKQASIDVTFDAAALEASDASTRDRLRGDKFFWVAKHPTVRFTGTSLAMTSPTRGTVAGKLTARGVTKRQTLEVVFEEDPDKAAANAPIRFTATTRIDRRDYGMTSYQLVVGNNVDVTMKARMVPR